MDRRGLVALELQLADRPTDEADRIALQTLLQREPSRLDVRLRLYELCLRAGPDPLAAVLEHVPVFVRDAPYLLATDARGFIPAGHPVHAALAEAWEAALTRFPGDVEVMLRASAFFSPFDFARAHAIVADLARAEPKNWMVRMTAAHHYLRGVLRFRPDCSPVAALEHYEAVITMAKLPFNCVHGSASLAAWLAGRYSKASALGAISVAPSPFIPQPEIHRGHTVLGLVALREDNVAEAERRLGLARTQSTGRYGPSFLLVDALVARTLSSAVEDYVAHMAGVPGAHTGACQRWLQSVRAGQPPSPFATSEYQTP